MADGHPAVFLDRDGTLIEDPGFLHQPGQVKLLSIEIPCSSSRARHADKLSCGMLKPICDRPLLP